MIFYVYIVECKDTSLYSGFTTDLERRIIEHNSSKRGARYTKQRRPVSLRYYEKFRTLKKALRREIEIKRLTRGEKLELIHISATPSQKRHSSLPK